MSSSPAIEEDAPDLVCQLDNVQGMVDALACVRWKRHQVFVLPSPENVSRVFNSSLSIDFPRNLRFSTVDVNSLFPGCFNRVIRTRNCLDR